MAFICQSVWACVANFGVKTFTFKACNLRTQDLVASHATLAQSCCPNFTFLSFDRAAVRMQVAVCRGEAPHGDLHCFSLSRPLSTCVRVRSCFGTFSCRCTTYPTSLAFRTTLASA